MRTFIWSLPMLALAVLAGGAFAQPVDCSGISERYEDALARRAMSDTRMSLVTNGEATATDPVLRRRINNEIIALGHVEDGASVEEVVLDYRLCRFDLRLDASRLIDLVEAPQTVVGSTCLGCQVAIAATNNSYETLYTLSQMGGSMSVLNSVLEDRNRQVDHLLVCEQTACRQRAEDRPPAITVDDYVRAMEASEDPDAWAAGPVVVTELPDYWVPEVPVGQYPVDAGSVGR